jgi:hypothetical protein
MKMAEVHVNVGPNDKSGTAIVFHSPGQSLLVTGAGQTITQTKDVTGKPIATSGQVPNSTVVFNSPA